MNQSKSKLMDESTRAGETQTEDAISSAHKASKSALKQAQHDFVSKKTLINNWQKKMESKHSHDHGPKKRYCVQEDEFLLKKHDRWMKGDYMKKKTFN